MAKLDPQAIAALHQQRRDEGEDFTPFIDSVSDAVYYFILVGGDISLDNEGDAKKAQVHYAIRASGGLLSDKKLAMFVAKRVNSFRVSLSRIKKEHEENTGKKFIPFKSHFVGYSRMADNTNDVRMTWEFATDAAALDFSKIITKAGVDIHE